MERGELSVTEREIRSRRGNLLLKSMIALMVLVLIGLGTLLIYELRLKTYENPWAEKGVQEASSQTGSAGGAQSSDGTPPSGAEELTGADSDPSDAPDEEETLSLEAQANLLAAQYDYDAAIQLLRAQPGYDRSNRFKNLTATYESTKEGCTSYPIDQITHVFFHTLIADDAKAFDGDEDSAGYNQVMTTISEFDSILTQMYNRGFVMVSLHDMVEVAEDGSVTAKEIRLPVGKTPFVLSQDDCSYYHYMDGDGFAQKLIVAEDGTIRNTYLEEDGSVSVGDYDVVPLVDRFVEQHPDFSYHGHKGILALTGYEGVLGYRTDEVYKTRQADRLTKYQTDFLESHPDFDFDAEVEQASAVADAMKAEGWEFASHTWGHIDPKAHSLEAVQLDTGRWKGWVEPVVGNTDVLIFAFGADIGDWEPYTRDNPYFAYYKSQGFDIYCNVDSSVKAWVQVGADFLRQGRRNLDGYRMYYSPELISDLYDVDAAWDANRPTPVPEM